MEHKKIITILVDNESWILPYAKKLETELELMGIDAKLVRCAQEIRDGWVCFFLGCVRLVKDEYLRRNKHNLVVHESDLPKGRGFAPMTWQILEGKNSIPICLLEASVGEPDAGDIWLRDVIELNGSELLPVWRNMQGEKTLELCVRFIEKYDSLKPVKQVGEATYYARRRPCDSEIDINKPLADQLNHLRVVDNERYPAFVNFKGAVYILKIKEGSCE